MADQQVINTGPLVTLARADLLELLDKLPIDFVCPQEVIQELMRVWEEVIQMPNPGM